MRYLSSPGPQTGPPVAHNELFGGGVKQQQVGGGQIDYTAVRIERLSWSRDPNRAIQLATNDVERLGAQCNPVGWGF